MKKEYLYNIFYLVKTKVKGGENKVKKKEKNQTKESEVNIMKNQKSFLNKNKRNNTNCPCRNNCSVNYFSSNKYQCRDGRRWNNKESRVGKKYVCKFSKSRRGSIG